MSLSPLISHLLAPLIYINAVRCHSVVARTTRGIHMGSLLMAPKHVVKATPADPLGWHGAVFMFLKVRAALVAIHPESVMLRVLPAWWEQGHILRVAESCVRGPLTYACLADQLHAKCPQKLDSEQF